MTCGDRDVGLAPGELIAPSRFEEGVQEVLAVPVFPVHRYPETVKEDAKRLENSCDVLVAALADAAGTSRIGSCRNR
jgi:hypothetical protein